MCVSEVRAFGACSHDNYILRSHITLLKLINENEIEIDRTGIKSTRL